MSQSSKAQPHHFNDAPPADATVVRAGRLKAVAAPAVLAHAPVPAPVPLAVRADALLQPAALVLGQGRRLPRDCPRVRDHGWCGTRHQYNTKPQDGLGKNEEPTRKANQFLASPTERTADMGDCGEACHAVEGQKIEHAPEGEAHPLEDDDLLCIFDEFC